MSTVHSDSVGKVFVFGVFLVRIQSKCGKIQTRKTPNTDTFHEFESNVCEGAQKSLAVIDFSINQRCKVDTVNQMIRDYSPQPTCDSGYL